MYSSYSNYRLLTPDPNPFLLTSPCDFLFQILDFQFLDFDVSSNQSHLLTPLSIFQFPDFSSDSLNIRSRPCGSSSLYPGLKLLSRSGKLYTYTQGGDASVSRLSYVYYPDDLLTNWASSILALVFHSLSPVSWLTGRFLDTLLYHKYFS